MTSSGDRKRPNNGIVDPGVHVNKTDLVVHLMAGEAACAIASYAGANCPVRVSALTPRVERQALHHAAALIGYCRWRADVVVV